MLRFTGRVAYLDGSESGPFQAGTASIAAWERYAVRNGYSTGVDAPAALSDLVVAHHALAIPEGFDVWVETVLSVELEKDEEAVPPTAPTLKAAESS